MNKIMAKLAVGLIVLCCVQSNAASRVAGISEYELEHPNAIGVINYLKSPAAQGKLTSEGFDNKMSIDSKTGMQINLRYLERYDIWGTKKGHREHFWSNGSVLVEIILLDTGAGQGKFDLAVSDSELIYEIYGADKNKSLDVVGHFKLDGNITISCESDKKCTALNDI